MVLGLTFLVVKYLYVDEICKHIDYNSHILNQFRRMDLETAIEQRNNYVNFCRIMDEKIAYAQIRYIKKYQLYLLRSMNFN